MHSLTTSRIDSSGESSMFQDRHGIGINLFTSPVTEPAWLSLEQSGKLYHWCGADVYSVLGHLIVIASRGRSRLAHLDKPQGSTMAGSLTLPFLHVQDDISEVDHGILYRLIQDMRMKSRDTN